MQMKKKTLLLIGTFQSTFVQHDADLLSKHYQVIRLDTNGYFSSLSKTIILTFKMITNCFNSDIIFSWFADYYSLFPMILGTLFQKKTVINVGGFDGFANKELNYGGWLHPIRKVFIQGSLHLSTHVITVSHFLQKELIKRDSKIHSTVIYLSIDENKWKWVGTSVKNKYNVLTVGSISSEISYKRKGVDRWLMVVKNNPDHHFTWIGLSDTMRKNISEQYTNMTIYSYIDNSKLKTFFESSYFYLQPSRIETFGVSVLEAMMMGCFPMVSIENSLPEVVGNNGVIISEEKWETLKISNYHNSMVSGVIPFSDKRRITELIHIIDSTD